MNQSYRWPTGGIGPVCDTRGAGLRQRPWRRSRSAPFPPAWSVGTTARSRRRSALKRSRGSVIPLVTWSTASSAHALRFPLRALEYGVPAVDPARPGRRAQQTARCDASPAATGLAVRVVLVDGGGLRALAGVRHVGRYGAQRRARGVGLVGWYLRAAGLTSDVRLAAELCPAVLPAAPFPFVPLEHQRRSPRWGRRCPFRAAPQEADGRSASNAVAITAPVVLQDPVAAPSRAPLSRFACRRPSGGSSAAITTHPCSAWERRS